MAQSLQHYPIPNTSVTMQLHADEARRQSSADTRTNTFQSRRPNLMPLHLEHGAQGNGGGGAAAAGGTSNRNGAATPSSSSSSSSSSGLPLPLPTHASTSLSCSQWLAKNIWPGMGLFGESYLLFSIGTLKPIWQMLFPNCFNEIDCPSRLLHSLTYSVVIGVIIGMIVLGYMANTIGRRKGSIITASFMCGGALGLYVISVVLVNNALHLYRAMSCLLFLFGIGVGGEYPLSASSASERAMEELQRKRQLEAIASTNRGDTINNNKGGRNNARLKNTIDGNQNVAAGRAGNRASPTSAEMDESVVYQQAYRGRQVQTVFSMQGVGIWFNSVIMTVLLVVTGQTGGEGINNDDDNGNNDSNNEYDEGILLAIWRTSYAIGAIVLAGVLISRILYLEESAVWQDDRHRRNHLQVTGANATMSASVVAPGGLRSPTTFNSQIPMASPTGTNVSSLSMPTLVHDRAADDKILLNSASFEDAEQDHDVSPTMHLLRNYGMRIVGASMAWLLWDIAFYGNKLFQSSFLLALTGESTTLLEFAMAASLNATVALFGYFGAAIIVDHPAVGRVRLQQVGFLLTGTLFVGCGFLFDKLSSGWLVAMYLGSSFFGQLGPNATTFLIPAEIFPTEVRTMCHGIAAASGKVGALTAAIMFNHVADVDMFLFSGYASFAACVITYWCIPETNGLDLYELDKKWRLTLDGRKEDYSGPANHPNYLSTLERQRRMRRFHEANEIEDSASYQMWHG